METVIFERRSKMKKLLVLVVLCGLVPVVNAVDVAGKEIGVTVDATFMSKYIWRGFDVLDDTAVWQPSVNFDLGGGFNFNVWAAYPGGGGTTETGASRVNLTEYDYTLSYNGSILEDCYKTDYTVGWRYYDYIDTASQDADMQEAFVEFAMPQLIGGGITPHAAYYQMWKARSGGGVSIPGGAIFVTGFNYDFALQQAPELPMTLSWDIVYNDGVLGVDHDFSHMLWGLKTKMTCPMTGATITPAVYFQNSMDSSVNDEDELFAGLSYTLKF